MHLLRLSVVLALNGNVVTDFKKVKPSAEPFWR